MDRNKLFQPALFPQADQKRFMKESTGWDHRQKMRFVSNQDMFILINDTLKKGDSFFAFQLAVIENAGPRSIRTR